MKITEGLRELANDLRKLAAEWEDSNTPGLELDSEKVLDFLLFYGGGARNAR